MAAESFRRGSLEFIDCLPSRMPLSSDFNTYADVTDADLCLKNGMGKKFQLFTVVALHSWKSSFVLRITTVALVQRKQLQEIGNGVI
ncbi:hypothetical protein RB195_017434 [Necator americanus]|uniref:Uncharacterized protein n=1 Tax=Necator americanus TaxID=51031 RepID=A0ABR1C8U5_NECAM